MKRIKTFESWNNNIIDNSLFSSGKAKYNPRVFNGIIKYRTGFVAPYFFAEISKKGDKFICKIYKKKKNGDEIRLRNKLKKELKLAHNYVREFLNQQVKKSKLKKTKVNFSDVSNTEKIIKREKTSTPIYQQEPFTVKPTRKTTIRKF